MELLIINIFTIAFIDNVLRNLGIWEEVGSFGNLFEKMVNCNLCRSFWLTILFCLLQFAFTQDLQIFLHIPTFVVGRLLVGYYVD